MTSVALTLLGFGLGALIMTGGGQTAPRASADALRDRAIEAQRISAAASQRARELAAQWSAAEEARRFKEGR